MSLVPIAALGSARFPILVQRGERDEALMWLATFRNLPGYLGVGANEVEAIKELWRLVGDGPVYDVSKSRGLDPTPEAIRKWIELGQKGAAAQAELRRLDTQKDSAIVAVAKSQGISRNSLKPMMRRADKWAAMGEDKAVASLPRENQQVLTEIHRDPQAFFEGRPALMRMLLARIKFPAE